MLRNLFFLVKQNVLEKYFEMEYAYKYESVRQSKTIMSLRYLLCPEYSVLQFFFLVLPVYFLQVFEIFYYLVHFTGYHPGGLVLRSVFWEGSECCLAQLQKPTPVHHHVRQVPSLRNGLQENGPASCSTENEIFFGGKNDGIAEKMQSDGGRLSQVHV